jgi:hypothetical protein
MSEEAPNLSPNDHAAPRVEQRTGRTALRFVLLIGILSFFADFTYEGSRSILGPYLALLQASGTVVGVVTGFGELLGYGLRLVSGRLTDAPRQYWPIRSSDMSCRWLLCPPSRWSTAGQPPRS